MSQKTNQKPSQKKKSARKNQAATAAVLCFVAAIAIVGTYTFKDYRKTKQLEEMAQAEEQIRAKEEQAEQANTDNIQNDKIIDEAETLVIETREDASGAAGEDSGMSNDGQTSGTGNGQSVETGSVAANVSFSAEDQLLWPVSGSICMNYSMDKTIYFQTLDQYKYNPALVIAGTVGDQVIASAPGIVKSVDVTAETGTTVNVDLGNGYELFYGQLKEVPVKAGDYVEANTVIGYVSEPTKYYSVEGANVYFEMRKDGQPVNPLDYMAE